MKGKEGMEPDDLLYSRNARSRTPLARSNGTSRRASGWAGEKDARSEGQPGHSLEKGYKPLAPCLSPKHWQLQQEHSGE